MSSVHSASAFFIPSRVWSSSDKFTESCSFSGSDVFLVDARGSEGSASTGIIAGVVGGVICAIVIGCIIVWLLVFRKRPVSVNEKDPECEMDTCFESTGELTVSCDNLSTLCMTAFGATQENGLMTHFDGGVVVDDVVGDFFEEGVDLGHLFD